MSKTNFKHSKMAIESLALFLLITTAGTTAADSGVGSDKELTLTVINRLERLENVVLNQQAELKDAKTEIEALKQRLSEVEDGTNGNRLEESKDENPRVSGQRNPSLDRGTRQEGLIAFTAYLDHPVTHLGIDQTIVYNKTLLNEGNAFYPATGHFVCPVAGHYVFNFVVHSAGNSQIVAKLVVDGVNQLDGISDTFHEYHEAQGGNFMILSLTRGQTVAVEAYRHPDTSIMSSSTFRFASFSGYILY